METFSAAREFVENTRYLEDRQNALAALDIGSIDEPIMDIVAGFATLPHCFTLQCCYGHFVCAPEQNPHNMEPIPRDYDKLVRYRIGYIVFCIENSSRGRTLRDSLLRIAAIDSGYIQFGSPDWFWGQWVNSYALQVEPSAHRLKDEAILGVAEAIRTQRARDLFFRELRELVTKEMSAHEYMKSLRITPENIMNFSQQQHLMISIEKDGPDKLVKQSFPLRFGKYSEIRTADFEFCFNLNGEIKSIRGLTSSWPHPAEQFKRTVGNDWVYYTVGDKGGDKGIISWMGEYYLPCLPYVSNPVWEISYFSNPVIMSAFAEWSQLFANLYMANVKGLYPYARDLITRILANDDRALYERSQQLNKIIGGRVSVLPPDTRHVDYDIIPLTIADGCLYHCKFCCVKSDQKFQQRSKENILAQVAALKDYFGANLVNYHALFLGNHDALAADEDVICFAAEEAYRSFGFRKRKDQKPFLYLFGSVGSFLKSGQVVFEKLNRLPFYTYINIGFESIDSETLSLIGKPITSEQVKEAFEKMTAINASFDGIEITGNFIAGDNLPPAHEDSLAELLRHADIQRKSKGAIYLSPLQDSPKKKELLPRFYKIKEESQLPVFAYLIQRL